MWWLDLVRYADTRWLSRRSAGQRVSVSRICDSVLQRQQAFRPVHARAAGRRPAAAADDRRPDRLRLQPPGHDERRRGRAAQGVSCQIHRRAGAQRQRRRGSARRSAAPSATITSSTRSRRAISIDSRRSSPTSRNGDSIRSRMPMATGARRSNSHRLNRRSDLAGVDGSIAAVKQKLAATTPELEAAQVEWERPSRRPSSGRRVRPVEAISAAAATLTVLDDASILASGADPETDTYTLKFDVFRPASPVFVSKTLPHDSLPAKGAGRAENGNFMLSEFVVRSTSRLRPATRARRRCKTPARASRRRKRQGRERRSCG